MSDSDVLENESIYNRERIHIKTHMDAVIFHMYTLGNNHQTNLTQSISNQYTN